MTHILSTHNVQVPIFCLLKYNLCLTGIFPRLDHLSFPEDLSGLTLRGELMGRASSPALDTAKKEKYTLHNNYINDTIIQEL